MASRKLPLHTVLDRPSLRVIYHCWNVLWVMLSLIVRSVSHLFPFLLGIWRGPLPCQYNFQIFLAKFSCASGFWFPSSLSIVGIVHGFTHVDRNILRPILVCSKTVYLSMLKNFYGTSHLFVLVRKSRTRDPTGNFRKFWDSLLVFGRPPLLRPNEILLLDFYSLTVRGHRGINHHFQVELGSRMKITLWSRHVPNYKYYREKSFRSYRLIHGKDWHEKTLLICYLSIAVTSDIFWVPLAGNTTFVQFQLNRGSPLVHALVQFLLPPVPIKIHTTQIWCLSTLRCGPGDLRRWIST